MWLVLAQLLGRQLYGRCSRCCSRCWRAGSVESVRDRDGGGEGGELVVHAVEVCSPFTQEKA